ncbi:MAG TPA: C40 family peptidase [Acidimicrobiales bacterium]|nr:C40 family peptidase [Acidimicrobiales bacterium]
MRLPKALAGCVAALMAAGVATAATVSPPRPGSAISQAAFGSEAGQGKGSAVGYLHAGMRAPASGIPVGTLPPVAAGDSGGAGSSVPASLPVPRAGQLPSVAGLRTLHSADAIVMFSNPMSSAQQARLSHLKGVTAVNIADTGTVNLAGAQVVTYGVDPATFRAFTPQSSASVDRLWQYLAGGALVSSYDMATDRHLQLGVEDSITPAGSNQSTQGWMGAFASLGLPGVDMVVDKAYSSDLALSPNTAAVVSAPSVAGASLQSEIEQALPGTTVELLRPSQVQITGGNLLGSSTRARIVSAALSKVGQPYVWGAAGPDQFDCSGLVQWAFRQAGILMPRTAAEQFLTGVHIQLSQAQPGDLLFWTYDPNDPTFVDHVAVYLGNGMMVEAPHTGLDVQVVPVPTANMAGVVQVVIR